jgi:hypothetical protein
LSLLWLGGAQLDSSHALVRVLSSIAEYAAIFGILSRDCAAGLVAGEASMDVGARSL